MKKLISFILCLILAIGTVPAAFAGTTISVTLTPDKDCAAVGEEVTFTVTLSGTPVSSSGAIAVNIGDGLELTAGAMTVSGAVMNSFDLSTNKGVSMFSSASSFDGKFASFTVRVLGDGPSTVEVEVKLNPSGDEATALYTLNDAPVKKAVVTVGNAASSGGVVTVGVVLSEAPFVKSLAVSDVEYDADVLELTGADWTLEGANIARFDPETGKGVAAFADEKDINGKIFELSFTVKDGAKDGDYPVSLTVTLRDKSGTEIPIETTSGVVRIKSEPVDPCAEGHSFGAWTVKTEATCVRKGSEERVCSRCGETETRERAALGHSFAEVVTAPTCTGRGYTTHTCSRCGESYVDAYVSALGHDFGSDGNAKKCSRCGEANPNYKAPEDKPDAPIATIEFEDVAKDAYYADAVNWAVANDVTKGISATKFGPDNGCTRGQVVTFLWRSLGQPAPRTKNNPFTDVKEGDYYYDAVLWAVGNGITAGTSKTTFSPESTCTRGQIVTFLYRFKGSPVPKATINPFGDVSAADYFCGAVLWAVGDGITAGKSATTFAPNDVCTRAQIVTFLYRAMN